MVVALINSGNCLIQKMSLVIVKIALFVVIMTSFKNMPFVNNLSSLLIDIVTIKNIAKEHYFKLWTLYIVLWPLYIGDFASPDMRQLIKYCHSRLRASKHIHCNAYFLFLSILILPNTVTPDKIHQNIDPSIKINYLL